MRLSSNQAADLARKFVRENFKDLPSAAYVVSRRYREAEQLRLFGVHYADANLHEEFILLFLAVKDDGTVELRKDLREIVAQQLKDKGTFLPGPEFSAPMLQDRLMQAIRDPAASFPEWFVEVRLEEGDDYDAIALIKSEDGSGLTFPITLFRRKSDKARFFKSYTGDPMRRMGLIIPVGATPTEVRKRLIDQLTLQRKNFAPATVLH